MIDVDKPLKKSPRIGAIGAEECCSIAGITPWSPDDLKGLDMSMAHLILGVLIILSIRFIFSAEL